MKKRQIKNNEIGKLIAFEGIDGSGKSTQIDLLTKKIKEIGEKYYVTKEPTDSPIGSLIHQFMTGRIKTDNRVIAALFVADRIDHLQNEIDGIIHKIHKGVNVITDRYYFSSYAYHSVDMSIDWVINANKECSNILRPVATIFIDVDPDIAMKRITGDRYHTELFETKIRLDEVRKNYFLAFDKLKDEENVILINGNQCVEKIADDIWEKVSKYFM